MSAAVKTVMLFFALGVVYQSAAIRGDSLNMLYQNSNLSGNFRNYYMGTLNSGKLTDFQTLAIGGFLKYETGSFYGFSAGAAYYLSVNTGLGNPAAVDPLTGRGSRYEIANYDFNNREARYLPVWGELYLDYQDEIQHFRAGRMKYSSPLINPADGRMIPTLVQGAVYENRMLPKIKLDAVYLNAILPRATSEFFSVRNSFQHSPGINTFGTVSKYQGNTDSRFIAAGRAGYFYDSARYIEVWNYFADDIFNTLYSEAGYRFLESGKWHVDGKVQHLYQSRVAHGGNENPEYRYFESEKAQMTGGRIKLYRGNTSLSINGNFITDQGRFVFPRAWGRDPSFTFLRRERAEGMGNFRAWMIKAEQDVYFNNGGYFNLRMGYGHYFRPDAEEAELNKYGIPSNNQANLGLLYDFGGRLNGLRAEAIAVYKGALNELPDQPDYIFNKVEMLNYQVILNYWF